MLNITVSKRLKPELANIEGQVQKDFDGVGFNIDQFTFAEKMSAWGLNDDLDIDLK